MTWVLGAGMPFGYGALISDVRVSWPGGQYLDCLQKIHLVGNGILMGFAGSVDVGFFMLEAMRRQWGADPGELYPVKFMAWHWHRWARWAYQHLVNPRFHRLGCELAIAGVSNKRCGLGACAHAVTMRAPDFEPTFVPPATWGSVGSGTEHETARHYADEAAFMNVFAHGEVGSPDGAATFVAHSVANSLEQAPMADVSPIVQVGIVRPTAHEFKMLEREHRGAFTIARERAPEPRELVEGWRSFRATASAAGLDATAAVT